MTVEEFDSALTELETRVDRLRALYENWFRGYEKTEPHVPRKDVERRVYGLRKELPRNTALRFRYHQLYLKYTTMANYWQRTARQIEDGTYKPQLLRLKRKLDKEQELKERRDKSRKEREEGEPKDGPRGYELDLDESLNVDDLLDELELGEVAKALDMPGPHSEPPPPTKQHARLPPAPAAAPLPARAPEAALRPAAAAPGAPIAAQVSGTFPHPKKLAGAAAPAAPTTAAGSVSNLRSPAELRASTAQPLGPPGAPISGREPLPKTAPATPPTFAHAPEGALRPAVAKPPAASPTGQQPLARPLPGAPPPAPGAARPVAPPPVVPRPAVAVPPAGVAARPLAPLPGAGPGAAPPRPPLPSPGAAPTAAPRPGLPAAPAPARPATTVVGRPVQAPPPAQRPVPATSTIVGRPPLAAPPAASSGAPNEQRLKHIYDEYLAARRRNNEGEVRYEAMVSSIQKMLPELSKKHQGKRIDFDVVVKDGRVGLKPKAT